MSLKYTFATLLLTAATAGSVTAQIPDQRKVVIAAMQYVRSTLGDKMVVDARMRFSAEDTALYALADNLKNVGITTGVMKDKLRCPAYAPPYLATDRKYVTYRSPVISGDSASIEVSWAYTPPGGRRYMLQTQTLQLRKITDRWKVSRSGPKQYVDAIPMDCAKKLPQK